MICRNTNSKRVSTTSLKRREMENEPKVYCCSKVFLYARLESLVKQSPGQSSEPPSSPGGMFLEPPGVPPPPPERTKCSALRPMVQVHTYQVYHAFSPLLSRWQVYIYYIYCFVCYNRRLALVCMDLWGGNTNGAPVTWLGKTSWGGYISCGLFLDSRALPRRETAVFRFNCFPAHRMM